jgi:rhodanese-related sulfurtransferase
MIKFYLILLLSLIARLAIGQQKDFVCTPCGLECDSTVVHHDGVCASCGMALVEKTTVGFKNLSFEEICQRIAANPKVLLLDVRTPQEFNGSSGRQSYGHFKNAVNINVEQLQSRVGEISKYKDQEVIVYCSHSHRSPRATYFLSSQGFTNVSNMAGGVSTLVDQENNECLKERFVYHKK